LGEKLTFENIACEILNQIELYKILQDANVNLNHIFLTLKKKERTEEANLIIYVSVSSFLSYIFIVFPNTNLLVRLCKLYQLHNL